MASGEKIKENIMGLVKQYYKERHQQPEFKEGGRIPVAGRVFDENELISLVDSSLEFWLTGGRYTEEFEKGLADYLKVKHCSLVNSGSSANLIAFMALTSPLLGERAIKEGDEVITVAAAFPTTVSPIIQFGAVPVFVDITLPQYNIDVSEMEKALTKKTKAVMIAHTLGNPADLRSIKSFCDSHNLWLVEDNCDALGSVYNIGGVDRLTGTIGDIGASSFYPAHHITMGEGGAVYTDNSLLAKIVVSLRDWGRDCICPTGNDNLCKNRFNGKHGLLPMGYDHKYVYSHFGYNLKATDMQAAIGVEQLKKLEGFTEKRRENWSRLKDGVKGCEKHLILPEECENSRQSPFGFMVTLKDGTKLTRSQAIDFFESRGIQTRMLFSGNITLHPCFDSIRGSEKYRIASDLGVTGKVLNDSFWVGVYPGLGEKQIDYIIKTFNDFFKG